MLDTFRQILEVCLFNQKDSINLALIPDVEKNIENGDNRKQLGVFYFPTQLIPKNCQIKFLPNGEDYLSYLETFKQTLRKINPNRLFIHSSWSSSHYLNEEFKQKFPQYPQYNFASILLETAIDLLPQDSLIGTILPNGFLTDHSSKRARQQIFTKASPQFIIFPDHPLHEIGFNEVHSSFRADILILKTGNNQPPITKFFKYSEKLNSAEVLKDVKRLNKQNGGQTQYGYIIRDDISYEDSISFEKFHPELLAEIKDIETIGNIYNLSEFGHCFIGLNPKTKMKYLSQESTDTISLINASDILKDGSLNMDDNPHKIKNNQEIDNKYYLRSGDLCFRRIISSKSHLIFLEITDDILPLLASDSVIVFRFNSSVILEDRQFILNYLRSEFPIKYLKSQGLSMLGNNLRLDIFNLVKLPTPIADKELKEAIKSLDEAQIQLQEWISNIKESKNQLFQFNSIQESRPQILSTGRTSRQRVEHAKLIDDFDYRVRTRFPYPIALRWRTIKTAHPDFRGYKKILDCAEATICYLAHIAIILSQHERCPISHIKNVMSPRLIKTKHGTNFGDWVAIVREINSKNYKKKLENSVPFIEILDCLLNEPAIDIALQNLSNYRNDDAHGRGPEESEFPYEFEKAMEELDTFLQGSEFISEYPLRYIESTKRDTLLGITHYTYRDLMGDHPLTPIEKATCEQELEASSLYLVDRDKKLYLFRPFLIYRECPECRKSSIFYVDKYNQLDNIITFKSMEHGHTTDDSEVAELFKKLGFLT